MSLTYVPRRKSVRPMIENQAGAACVGKLFETAGLPTNGRELELLRAPYQATEQQAKAWARAIRTLPYGLSVAAWTATARASLHDDNQQKWSDWSFAWVEFLEHCGGYQAE